METLSFILLGMAFAMQANAEYNCKRLDDCQNNAICESDGNCTCTHPENTYYNCKYDITSTPCSTICQNGGTCVTVSGSPVCACPYDYYGANCEKELVEIGCLGGTAKYTIRIPQTFNGTVELSAASLPTPAPTPCVPTGLPADGYKVFAVTFDIGTGTTNCAKTYLETNTTDGDTSYTAKFLVRYSADLTTSIDELYTLTCTHTGSEIIVYKEITDVSLTATDLDTTSKEKQFQSVAMTLQKDNAPLTGPIVVGTVFEVVVYVDDPEAFDDVFIDSCIANNTLAGAALKTYEIFKSGCPTAKGKMTTAEQVIYSFIESGVNKTAKSISIQAFKFRDTQKLGLTCTARMCKAGDDSCAAPTDCDAVRAAPAAPTEATTTTTTTAAPTAPTPSAGGTRKKRAADDVTEETVSTVVTVLNPGETLVSTSTVAGNKTSVADPETCLAHGSIVSVIAILGGLVGILLLACLALACVIMRRREPKLLESVAHSGFAIPRAHTNGAYTREY